MVKLYAELVHQATRHSRCKDRFRQLRGFPDVLGLLEAAAAEENRSLTNMRETLLFSHCQAHGIDAKPPKTARKFKGVKS